MKSIRAILPSVFTAIFSLLSQGTGYAAEDGDALSWFRRGDANVDGRVDVADVIAITLTGGQLLGDPVLLRCEKAADTDDNGNVDLKDALYLLTHLLLHGPKPAEPFGACAEDPTPDALTCHSHPPCFKKEIADRRDRIREHFAERLQRKQIVTTTVTESGQVLDWIVPESQTLDGTLATPPPALVDLTKPAGAIDPQLADRPTDQQEVTGLTEVQTQPAARGPQGTVPVVRFDVEGYLERAEIPAKDPRSMVRKLPPPAPDENDRYYAAWQRRGPVYGTTGRINIWNTLGPLNDDETSIAQTAVIRGSPAQTVEAGKVEHLGLNGDRRAHFFTWFTTDGHATQDDWVGGYNTHVDGWIQRSSDVAPGMSLAPWMSIQDGDQYSLDVQVRLWNGNWWVWAAGEWAGYYPYCVGGEHPIEGPCAKGPLFSESGLRDQADRLDWYGEVFDATAPAPTSTDMGSGSFAEEWWQRAAYFRNLTFFWAPNSHWWWDSGGLIVTDSACYNGLGPFFSDDASWKNWFFYGGPGNEAEGCN